MNAPVQTPARDAVTSAEADFGHLKRLLLFEERRQIEALRQEVSALDERLGSNNRFCRAVADSLVVALKVAEVEQHRELAGAMAPIVVAGIRREIADSKDMMVEALYPIVGRLVATAVAQALRQLAEDVNRRIESVLSPRSLRMRIKALLSRRPLAELVLAEAALNRIDTLLLLDRASGAVLASSSVQDGRIEASARGTDALNLLGGLMAAIIEFANHALSDVDGELRTLDFGGRTVLLRASPLHVVAAISRGSTSAGLDASVDRAFLAFLEEKPQDEAAALAAMHGRFVALHGPKPWNRRVSALTLLGPAFAAALLAGGLAGWLALRARSDDAGTLARLAEAPELAGFPVSLRVERERGVLTASALVPDAASWSAVRRRIENAFPDLRIEERVAVLAETPEARRTRTALSEAQDAAGSLRGRIEALATRLDGLAPALDGLKTGQQRDGAALRDDLAALAEQVRRVEQSTDAALAERPSRADVAKADEAVAAALRRQFDALATRLDGLTPALEGLETGQKRDAATLRADLAALTEQIGRIGQETESAFAQRPSHGDMAKATQEMAASLRGRIEALATRLDGLVPAMTAIETGHKRDEAALRTELTALAEHLRRVERETDDALARRPSRTEMDEANARTAARLTGLSASLDSPRRRLLDTIERTAVFFKDDAGYRDPAKAAAALARLAEVLRAEPEARLRVVGFGDSLGTAKTNLKVGRLRAEKVVADLARLGIASERLKAVASVQPAPPSDDVGAASAGRRVTFELINPDE